MLHYFAAVGYPCSAVVVAPVVVAAAEHVPADVAAVDPQHSQPPPVLERPVSAVEAVAPHPQPISTLDWASISRIPPSNVLPNHDPYYDHDVSTTQQQCVLHWEMAPGYQQLYVYPTAAIRPHVQSDVMVHCVQIVTT